MRIHTKISPRAIVETAQSLGLNGFFTQHRSLTSTHSFEVKLHGTGYLVNSGNHGAGDEYGATWDEWGAFLGRLYKLDHDMVVGSSRKKAVYKDELDFNEKTGYRFEKGEIPDDTHRRHKWNYAGPFTFECTGCSAEMRTRV